MHLVIAISMIHKALGCRARVLGGDTDSLKIALDGITTQDVISCLSPLHDAVSTAIAYTQGRVRECYPGISSALDGIGTFDDEGTNPRHMEAWNKARVYWDGKRCHVTCAGLPRPKGTYTIETWLNERVSTAQDFERLAPQVLGYNVYIANGVSHVLERTSPHPWERVDMDVTDFRGVTSHVSAYKSIALYDSGRMLGDTRKWSNGEAVSYQHEHSFDIDTREREITKEGINYV